jgi:competence CoiA-like predicted nuclease
MLFASDFEDNRVHIDDTHSNQEYYCPYCGAPLVTKKGDIR